MFLAARVRFSRSLIVWLGVGLLGALLAPVGACSSERGGDSGGAMGGATGGRSGSGGASGGTGGAPAPGGSGGAQSGGANGSASGGVGSGGSGSPAMGGAAGISAMGGGLAATGGGGVGSGGISPGTGGAGRGGMSGAGQSASGGMSSTGGGAGGGAAGNCGGLAISLSANGTAAESDAAYARVIIDMMTDLPVGNTSRTLEFWAFIKTTDWLGEKNELFEYGGTGSAAAFGLDFGTNPVTGMPGNHATLNPITNGGFNDDSTNDLGINSSANQWVHVAMTWDGVTLRTYVNGLLGISTTGTGGVTRLATAQSPLTIGCNFQNMNCFNGYLDELRLWNVARTPTQLKDSFNHLLSGNEAGLVGYWRFDDAPGATMAADAISGGRTKHPGTLNAASPGQRPTFITPPTPVPLICP